MLYSGIGILLTLGGCSSKLVPVSIRFAAKMGRMDVACGVVLPRLGPYPGPVTMTDFRFFVSDVRLLDQDGIEVPLLLKEDQKWQHQGVVLLDFENGEGPCSEKGTAEVNDRVVGFLPKGNYRGLVFNLGVPFPLNHLDVSTASSPLNLGAMFWSWQAGYKFLRVEVKTITDHSNPIFYFAHLGSTGCVSPSAVLSPEQPCLRPNLARIRLEAFDPKRDMVVADLAGLFADISIADSTPAPPGCMGDPTDPDCPRLLVNLGLSPDTGECLNDCRDQSFFRVVPATP